MQGITLAQRSRDEATGVGVKNTLPGFQRKVMLWPIPVVRGEILIQETFREYKQLLFKRTQSVTRIQMNLYLV